ncbi:unnamed protein product [Laminaria digitata]
MTPSWMERPLQRVFVDLAGPRKIASAGGALYLILFKDDMSRMGWIYPLRTKSAADVAAATKQFLADVGDGVQCFRTDNGTEFVNETLARLCGDRTIRHEHTEADGPKHNGVVERGLGLIQEGGMAACFEAPRLFPEQLTNLHRYWVEAAVYMNDCLNTTATTANANCKSPYEMFFGRLPPANTLGFMQPGFRRIHRSHKSDPKAERCFYLNRGRNHPRDCVKVPATPVLEAMPPVMTPVESLTPPMVMSPPEVMSPSSPLGIDNPQVDEGPPDNELLKPGRTRARTKAYHQASTAARSAPADHALFNQRPPNQPTPALPTCAAHELPEPTTYREAMQSPYHENLSYAMGREITGLEEAGTFEDA